MMMTPSPSSSTSPLPPLSLSSSRQKSTLLQVLWWQKCMRCQQNVTKKQKKKILFKQLPLQLWHVICNCFHLRSSWRDAHYLFVHFFVCLHLFPQNVGLTQDIHAIIWTYSPFKSWRQKMHLKLVTVNILQQSRCYCCIPSTATLKREKKKKMKKKKGSKHNTLQNEPTNKRIKLLAKFTHTSFVCTDRGAQPQTVQISV